MYKKNKMSQTSLRVNEGAEGETIEMKIRRIVNNKEPIKDGAPLIYTERKNGVNPATDIRTDRWDMAIDITDKLVKDREAKRNAMEIVKEETKGQSTDGQVNEANSN